MSPEEFQFATAAPEDNRKLIAAGKLQKWDVIKWAVTVNVALATAFIALLQHPGIGKLWYCALAGLVAFVAFALMLHYNDRLMNTRNDAKATYDYLLRNNIDVRTDSRQTAGCGHMVSRQAGTNRLHVYTFTVTFAGLDHYHWGG